MFKQMRRIKQQMKNEDCIKLLKSDVIGVLSVLGNDNYPYDIPINYYYSLENGKIYFYEAQEGYK